MDAYALEAQEKMGKTIENLHGSLATLRTGRASPSMLNGVLVEYYGEPTPLNQIASVTVPEPRQLLIKPYDRNDVKNVVTAINASNLGLNPINEGLMVRLIIPALTEERRKEIVKTARKYAEEAKVAVRNIRRDYMEILKIDDSYPEDLLKRAQDDVQKVTDEAVAKIDEILAEKEKDIMAV